MKQMQLLVRSTVLAVLMLFGFANIQAQTDTKPLVFFVSQKTGNDVRNGVSWQSAFKTLNQALKQARSNPNKHVIIYMAEGDYEAPTVNSKEPGVYAIQTEGRTLEIVGGFPTPSANTLPLDTCASAPRKLITSISALSNQDGPLFKIQKNNQKLVLRGLTFKESNFRTKNTVDGALVTAHHYQGAGNCLKDTYLEITDCVIEGYKAGRGGCISYRGFHLNPHVKVTRTTIVKSLPDGSGGGFIGMPEAVTYYATGGSKLEFSYVTFKYMQISGSALSTCLIGWKDGGNDDPDAECYVKLDHVQIDNCKGGTASQQSSPIQIQGVPEVSITNSFIKNSMGSEARVMQVTGFKNFYSEGNQFWNNFSGDLGGVIGLYANKDRYDRDGKYTTQSITFKNDQFFRNHAGISLAKGTGGAVYINNSGAGCLKADVKFEGCDFGNNWTKTAEGGAVYIDNYGTTDFKNCTFCSNSTGVDGGTGMGAGGAIMAKGTDCVLTIDGCFFDSNRSKKGNSAVAVEMNTYTIKNSIFSNNESTEPFNIVQACGTVGNGGGAVAGDFINCRFINNKVGSYGGAIGFRNNNPGETRPTNITNCEFIGNEAKAGGAIGLVGGNGIVNITNCLMATKVQMMDLVVVLSAWV